MLLTMPAQARTVWMRGIECIVKREEMAVWWVVTGEVLSRCRIRRREEGCCGREERVAEAVGVSAVEGEGFVGRRMQAITVVQGRWRRREVREWPMP